MAAVPTSWRWVSPAGPVYQAGTLSGNPLAMTAGLRALDRLKPKLYTQLAKHTSDLAEGLAEAARKAGVPLQVNAVGIDDHTVLHRPAGQGLRDRDEQRHQGVRRLLHGDARARLLPSTVGVPSVVPLLAHTSKDVGATIKAAEGSDAQGRGVTRRR